MTSSRVEQVILIHPTALARMESEGWEVVSVTRLIDTMGLWQRFMARCIWRTPSLRRRAGAVYCNPFSTLRAVVIPPTTSS